MTILKKIVLLSATSLGLGLLASCGTDRTEVSIDKDGSIRASKIIQENASEELPAAATYFENPYEAIDAYAIDVDASYAKNIKTLAKHLCKNAKSDLEKARALYIWITKNISYDARAFNKNTYEDCTAEGVLKSRKSVCEGFSNLYQALGEEAGLEIEKVSGYAKGLLVLNGQQYEQPNHAWNRIKIDGQWRVFDATWGEGYATADANGQLICVKKFDNYWFNMSPYQAIFDHYPVSHETLPIIPAIDLEIFKLLPQIRKSYFETGFNPKTTYRAVRKDLRMQFPRSYDIKTPVKILEAPATKIITTDKVYEFKLVIPAAQKVAILDENNQWHYLKESQKGIWVGSYTPQKTGQLSIAVNTGIGGNSFNILMAYQVEDKAS